MRMTKLFGKHEKQRTEHGIKKVAAAAVVVAVALALTGVFPGGGLQEPVTVKAAEDDESQPKKGTMEFWQWERVMETISWKDDEHSPNGKTQWDECTIDDIVQFGQMQPILPIYQNSGNYYVPTGQLEDNKLHATNISSLSPNIDPNLDSFITRPIPSLYRIIRPESYKGTSFSGNEWATAAASVYALYEGDNGSPIHMVKNGWDRKAGASLEHSSKGYQDFYVWEFSYDTKFIKKWSWPNVYQVKKVVIRNEEGSGYIDAIRIDADGYFKAGRYGMWNDLSDEQEAEMTCDLFIAKKRTYTCINENWSIGANQVYTADADLILKDGVTLTVPEGAVLCVKKGAFFVNGYIKCYGTILVEDGGIIMPYEASGENGKGCYIMLMKGGTMIIEEGGRVYAGCPEGQLGTKNQGWLDMYGGSTLVNYGLLVAGKCDFNLSGSGGGTIENHPGGAMFLGYTVDDPTKFMGETYDASRTKAETLANALGLKTTGGYVGYAVDGNATTFLETWEGSVMATANNTDKRSVKIYARDKDYKYTEKTWKPN